MNVPHLYYMVQAKDDRLTVEEVLRNRLKLSHSLIVKLKQQHKIKVNEQAVFTNYQVKPGETVSVDLNLTEENPIPPENVPLNIVYEDHDYLVLNKPPGMSVHPSCRHQTGTLANAVSYYWLKQNKMNVFRPINRLDKDTSGLILIGQNQYAHQGIFEQIVARKLTREYTALVEGVIEKDKGTIDFPIARKTENFIARVALTDDPPRVGAIEGQSAVTHYRVLERFNGFTMVCLRLETGRTHQIRVHLSSIGYPLCGDTLYGGKTTLLNRQALHANLLSFLHPRTNKQLTFTCSLPDDMQQVVNLLKT